MQARIDLAVLLGERGHFSCRSVDPADGRFGEFGEGRLEVFEFMVMLSERVVMQP